MIAQAFDETITEEKIEQIFVVTLTTLLGLKEVEKQGRVRYFKGPGANDNRYETPNKNKYAVEIKYEPGSKITVLKNATKMGITSEALTNAMETWRLHNEANIEI